MSPPRRPPRSRCQPARAPPRTASADHGTAGPTFPRPSRKATFQCSASAEGPASLEPAEAPLPKPGLHPLSERSRLGPCARDAARRAAEGGRLARAPAAGHGRNRSLVQADLSTSTRLVSPMTPQRGARQTAALGCSPGSVSSAGTEARTLAERVEAGLWKRSLRGLQTGGPFRRKRNLEGGLPRRPGKRRTSRPGGPRTPVRGGRPRRLAPASRRPARRRHLGLVGRYFRIRNPVGQRAPSRIRSSGPVFPLASARGTPPPQRRVRASGCPHSSVASCSANVTSALDGRQSDAHTQVCEHAAVGVRHHAAGAHQEPARLELPLQDPDRRFHLVPVNRAGHRELDVRPADEETEVRGFVGVASPSGARCSTRRRTRSSVSCTRVTRRTHRTHRPSRSTTSSRSGADSSVPQFGRRDRRVRRPRAAPHTGDRPENRSEGHREPL